MNNTIESTMTASSESIGTLLLALICALLTSISNGAHQLFDLICHLSINTFHSLIVPCSHWTYATIIVPAAQWIAQWFISTFAALHLPGFIIVSQDIFWYLINMILILFLIWIRVPQMIYRMLSFLAKILFITPARLILYAAGEGWGFYHVTIVDADETLSLLGTSNDSSNTGRQYARRHYEPTAVTSFDPEDLRSGVTTEMLTFNTVPNVDNFDEARQQGLVPSRNEALLGRQFVAGTGTDEVEAIHIDDPSALILRNSLMDEIVYDIPEDPTEWEQHSLYAHLWGRVKGLLSTRRAGSNQCFAVHPNNCGSKFNDFHVVTYDLTKRYGPHLGPYRRYLENTHLKILESREKSVVNRYDRKRKAEANGSAAKRRRIRGGVESP